jgi:hypothetical protein
MLYTDAADLFAKLAGIIEKNSTTGLVMLRVQGACELDNGDLLLVTEFMEGGDLHSALRRGAVSWRRRLAAGRLVDICQPLHMCRHVARHRLRL